MIKPNQETVAGQRRHRPPPTGGRFCGTAATACVQEAHRTLSSTNRKQVGGIVGRYTSGDSTGSVFTIHAAPAFPSNGPHRGSKHQSHEGS